MSSKSPSPPPNPLNLANKIGILAGLIGMTQAELARRLSLQPSNLNHYLKGHGDVRAELFVRILRELGVDVEDLLNREIATRTGMKLEDRGGLGETVEIVADSLSPGDRKTMLSYLAKMAQVNLGARATPHVKNIRRWM